MIRPSTNSGTLGTLGSDFAGTFSHTSFSRVKKEKSVPSVPSVPRPVVSLLDECRQLGVQIWVEDDRLKWRAPPGTMDSRVINQLREHKAELIKALVGTGLKSRESYSEQPTEPTKPGFVGFVGTLGKDTDISDGMSDPPDSGYLEAIAFWPDSDQRRWRAVADANESGGMTRPQAEWAAFLAVVAAINEAEAKGESIAFRYNWTLWAPKKRVERPEPKPEPKPKPEPEPKPELPSNEELAFLNRNRRQGGSA